jgi:hypothetical protein
MTPPPCIAKPGLGVMAAASGRVDHPPQLGGDEIVARPLALNLQRGNAP